MKLSDLYEAKDESVADVVKAVAAEFELDISHPRSQIYILTDDHFNIRFRIEDDYPELTVNISQSKSPEHGFSTEFQIDNHLSSADVVDRLKYFIDRYSLGRPSIAGLAGDNPELLAKIKAREKKKKT